MSLGAIAKKHQTTTVDATRWGQGYSHTGDVSSSVLETYSVPDTHCVPQCYAAIQ